MFTRLCLTLLCALMLASCASGNGNRDAGGVPFDSGPDQDAAMDGGVGECVEDTDCTDDGIFCNGGLACVMGECQASAIPTCNDGVGCTRDECNLTTDMCENIPETSACPTGTVCQVGEGCIVAAACEFDSDCGGDGIFCNGDEVCVMGMCQSPMSGRECDDMNSCTMDACNETMGDCTGVEFPDILTNPMHCGTGADDCVTCPMADASLHQTSSCLAGACEVDCEMGYGDVDGDMSNGCECMAMGMDDLPDMMFVDSNCDGIDGDVGIGVFVAPTFVGGNDANPGTMAMPVATIQRGIAIASTSGRARMEVYVSAGTYSESVVLSNGVSVYGGYLATMDWARSASFVSEIRGGQTAVSGTGLSMDLEIQLLTIVSSDASAPGTSSYGVRVVNSTAVVRLQNNTIRSGAGAAGGAGGDGTPGTGGSRGRNGANGDSGGSDFNCSSSPCMDGGTSACATGGRGGNGGYGSSGGDPGDMGSTGSASGVGGAGGGGGVASPICTQKSGAGVTAPSPGGNAGADGSVGTMPTTPVGTVVTGLYAPAVGTDGTTGAHGGGGGGGGGAGGGRETGLCRRDRGGSGGGGGGGGCAGTHGTAGLGAGGSFGIFASSARVDAQDNTITVGNGGGGGRGGSGGDGGGPGGGGTGGAGADDARGGGNGSGGGRGGHSGGGSGGPGGPSYGIFSVTTAVTSSGNTITAGSGGTGGAGGTSALGTAPTGLTGNAGPTFSM